MMDWLREHQLILWILASGSLVMFIASLLIIPAIIVRIPSDYFAHQKRPPSPWSKRSAPIRLLILTAKNVAGVIFLIAGMVMIGLPGQGTLTMIIGLMLIDFPGKYRFECWLVARRPTARLINWLRHRAGRLPLMT